MTLSVCGQPDTINFPAMGALLNWHFDADNHKFSDEIGKIWMGDGDECDPVVLIAECQDLLSQTDPPPNIVAGLRLLIDAAHRGKAAALAEMEFYSPDQQRDERGRWGSGGGSAPVAPGTARDLLASGELEKGAAWARSLDDDNLWPRKPGSFLGGLLAKQQGFDAPPRVVDEGELQRVIAAGGQELWRGVGNERFAEQLRTGPLFPGEGIFGDGTYFANADTQMYVDQRGGEAATLTGGRAIAENYATWSARREGEGVVIHAALDPTAKVIGYRELERQMREAVPPSANPAPGAKYDAAAEAADRLRLTLGDPGRFAMARGYDAIFVARSPGVADQHVILNRAALIVSVKNYPVTGP